MVPSPPKTSSKPASRARAAGLGWVAQRKPAMRAVCWSATTPRPARAMRAAARKTRSRLAALSKLAIRPIFRNVSGFFFKQNQEFLVGRRPQKRRGGFAAPMQGGSGAGKLLQFTQDAGVDGRVRDDAGAFVGLGLASFELRFHEGEDSTAMAQQCNGGRQNDFKR